MKPAVFIGVKVPKEMKLKIDAFAKKLARGQSGEYVSLSTALRVLIARGLASSR